MTDPQSTAEAGVLSERHAQWIEAALDAHKFSTARLISLFEDQRPEAVPQRAAVLAALDAHPRARRATFLGITGTPGAGKSTLTGQLARRMHESRSDLRFAVLAVDPSSRFSGGALLGDRTRVRFAAGDARKGYLDLLRFLPTGIFYTLLVTLLGSAAAVAVGYDR